MAASYYDIQLENFEQILLAAGFTKVDEGYQPPVRWREHLHGDDVPRIWLQTWRLRDAVTLYIDYLLKCSEAVKAG